MSGAVKRADERASAVGVEADDDALQSTAVPGRVHPAGARNELPAKLRATVRRRRDEDPSRSRRRHSKTRGGGDVTVSNRCSPSHGTVGIHADELPAVARWTPRQQRDVTTRSDVNLATGAPTKFDMLPEELPIA